MLRPVYFVINQRGGMMEGSISRVMYCDHIEVGSHPHNVCLCQPHATNTPVLNPLGMQFLENV